MDHETLQKLGELIQRLDSRHGPHSLKRYVGAQKYTEMLPQLEELLTSLRHSQD